MDGARQERRDTAAKDGVGDGLLMRVALGVVQGGCGGVGFSMAESCSYVTSNKATSVTCVSEVWLVAYIYYGRPQ